MTRGPMARLRLFHFTCGHTGRNNEAPVAKAQAFIRVAERRDTPIDDVNKPCPNCRRSSA